MNANSTPGQRLTTAWRWPLLACLALHLCASAPAQTWYWSQASSPLNADVTGVAVGRNEFRYVKAVGTLIRTHTSACEHHETSSTSQCPAPIKNMGQPSFQNNYERE